MNTLTFLVNTIIQLYAMVLLLRIWMQWTRCDFYNPFSQFVVRLTQPVVKPLQRILPVVGSIDTASLLLAFILCTIKIPVLILLLEGRFISSPAYLLIGILTLMKYAGLLVFWIIILRSLMSWVSQGRSPVEYVLIQLTEPLMGPVRRLLPAMGGVDLSGMVVILILYLLNYICMDMFQLYWYQI